VRHEDRYLPIQECAVAEKPNNQVPPKPKDKRRTQRRGSEWNKDFDLKKGPKVWQAARLSGNRPEEAVE
jgi:hypothetical protein